MPPELDAEASRPGPSGLKPSLAVVLAAYNRPQLLRLVAERRARPKPFTLLRFFEDQGEPLLRALAGGISHAELYRRYTALPGSPVKCGLGYFCVALAKFRRRKGLPPRRKPRSENVTDPPP